jgi:1-acyl-sn-glycerol-3-phosphate acyltransferase
MKVYKFCTSVLSFVILILFRVKVIGKINEPKEGALLVCSNHVSLWDPILIACVLKRQVHFMAKKELFEKPVLKQLLPAVGTFPVSRNTSDITAVKKTLTYLKDGECVGMFLQGTRNAGIDPRMTDIKSGVGMILTHSGASALPVSIFTKHNKVAIGRKIYVTIGAPITNENYKEYERSRAAYQHMSDQLFENICTLSETTEKSVQSKHSNHEN